MNPTTLRSWTIDQEPNPPVRYRSKQKEQNLTKADIAMNLAYSTRTGVVLPSPNPTLLRVADYDFGDDSAGLPFGMSRLEAPMSHVITDEVDGASRYLTLEVEILLIAALGRAIDRVIGTWPRQTNAQAAPWPWCAGSRCSACRTTRFRRRRCCAVFATHSARRSPIRTTCRKCFSATA
jgi:hypothetical protein